MKWTQVLFGLCCLCFWGILTWSRFAGQHGDSWGSLLSAQAWLEHGSPELSAYQDKVDLYASQFYRTERGVYYFFPPFSAFLSVPFVALARLAGWQMWDAQAEGLLQRQICVLALCSLLAMLAYGYRCLMNDRTALAVAFATICGGALLGSLGGALNSQVPAIIFMTWAQVLFLRERYGTGDWKGWQIGCLLAFSYLCRPTGAIWALAALAYVSWRKPRQLPASLLSLALVVGLYSLACWHFFDTPIHRYYARRPLMTGLPDFSQQMFGILFSPGVGLFVFQPLLILPFILGPLYLRRNALFWCLYAQVLLHLVLVALQTDWWGGSTYGSRLTAETIVPLSCIAVMLGLPGRPWLRPFLLVGLAWSIWVNLWCAYFRFDSHPQWPPSFYTRESNRRVLWDWKLAPFWVTARQAQEFRNRSVKELFSNLTQPQFHLGWNVDQRPDGQRYITPLRDTDLSFLSTAASGVQSGAFVFRYAAPAPVAVRLNGSAWTVLPASPEVIDRCVFFKERAWGASTRLSFSQASGLQLYDLDVQNWDPHEPGGLIYGEGWGRDEELSEKSSFRWCFGPESRLRLVCTRPGPMRLIWRGQSPKAGTSLEVRLNGQPRAHFARLSTEEQGYQLDLEVPAGMSSLEFRFNQWGSSWGGDPRPLALSFRDLRLIPNAVK